MRGKLCVGVAAIVLISTFLARAADPLIDAAATALADSQPKQLELPVRVVDPDGKPVAKAKVSPWALRCSQGHGGWSAGDTRAKVDPADVFTDDDGRAKVLYPEFRDLAEQVRTISVSLHVDHPDFAYAGDLHIDVPLEQDAPHEIRLSTGVPLEVVPTIDGRPVDLADIHMFWSDGRSWRPGAALQKLADGVIKIPAMKPGANSLLVIKLDGERATHLSKIVDVNLKRGETQRIDVPLQPAVRIAGKLSDNVPRPVQNGRVKTYTLPPTSDDYHRVDWYSWAPVEADGTFVIDAWPAGEPMQLVALCEGYIAVNGAAPDCVLNPLDPAKDPFGRPQVFTSDGSAPIEVAMTPLVPCHVRVVDEDEEPVAGVSVMSWPNVGWWNVGSQIYCHPMLRGERLVRARDYKQAIDNTYAMPFQSDTNADGKATLMLPVGNERLAIFSDVYELPVILGRRDVRVSMAADKPTAITLRVQPRGTEKLGEWDKLAGVVFGCSTREGRRICALPGVREKMDAFAERFRDTKNQRDPQLLSEAYAAVADAFAGVGDQEEAARWRQKSAEQAAKVTAPSSESAQ